ncbi:MULTISPECIES: hypothetical protein [unclassified Pseudactinotalea]|uniref:hypothetical protein n=1 Tax=unclassified Pseudactinotalea TaxID=2649176 RepID=UPI00128DAC40|nr:MULTISPECIES: hypothetical protein [unclassified Pseudactinotalea]MPV50522.1 hypothetical protein [Pseudactinotalea sp. HY160]QGH70461.1 hypothetical protein GCE65_13890 [Pseudactinotalea sp. HY158]
MTDLVVDKEDFKSALGRLGTLVDEFDHPRNLVHSVGSQGETSWAAVSGSASFRQDFTLTVKQMQRDIDEIWTELKGLRDALVEAGAELEDIDEETEQGLELLSARLDADPTYIQGAVIAIPGMGPIPMMV